MQLFSRAHRSRHKGISHALSRGFLLLSLLATSSFAQALGSVSDAPVAASKTSSTKASTAQQVQLEGELEVVHEDDFKHKKSRTRHFLKTDSGERYELKFKGKVPQHQTGTKLRVKGAKSSNILYLDTSGTSSGSFQVLALAVAPNTIGEQKTLVILVNFQDQPSNKPWTPDQVKSLVFGTVSDFFKENSYQNTWLNGDVYGWYTIPLSSTTCDGAGIRDYAKQAATAAGANLSAYTRYVYVFPFNAACGWAGSATVGGNPSQSWINGSLDLSTVGHELGHNLGLEHSHAWSCSDGSIIGTSSCAAIEYGDGLDVMGAAPSGHFHAYQKERLGWLNNGVLPPITTVQSSGTYTIDPYEMPGTGPKALKILKGTDSYGYKTWYYVEYRQAIGFDSWIATAGQPGNSSMVASNVLNGVVIHTGYEFGGNTNYLLDMTPATYTVSINDPALASGQSFTDSAAGVTITTAWVNGTNAGITVTFGGGSSSTCTRAKPSVVMSPSQSASVAAGTPVAYTVAVTNNDSSACGSSTFNLKSAVPSGWSASLGIPALTVSPGSAGSTTLSVTSSSTALAGSYSIGATATNSANTAYSGTGSAAYSVGSGFATTATFSTSVTTDKTSYVKGDTVTVTASSASGGAPVANASVTFKVTKPNGSVVTQTATTGSNGQAVYKLRLNKQKDPAGTYQASGTAASNGSSATAATSFSVQ